MKPTKFFSFLPFLLASLLLAPSVMAQMTEDRRPETETEKDTRRIDDISAARSRYTETPEVSPDANDNNILAQLPRRGPGMPFPSRRGYPRGSYQTPWMNHGGAGHAVIGAAIGFGVGAALGAISNAHQGTPVGAGAIVGGALFGFIGGAIGAAHGGPHPFARRGRAYRPSWPEDDEESHLRSHPKDGLAEQSVSARFVSPSQPAGVEAMAPPSPGIPAVP
jgi:hypothetical protein